MLSSQLGVPETYLRLIAKESNRVPANLTLNSTKNPLIAHMYSAALFHIFSNKQFETMPLSLMSVPVLGLMAREGIDIQPHVGAVMVGNDLEQHYKLWRYFFSTYLYTKNLCAHKDLVNFMMLCVDYSFYLKSSFQRDVLLYYTFDFVTCGVTHAFDFSNIFTYVKNNILSNSCIEIVVLFEQFKQQLLPSYQGGNIASALAAFFKVMPDSLQTFSCLLKNQDYPAVERLCLAS
ncbi:MAG: hypothetical protein AAB323_00515 [Pseudomonadota bacterium]